METVKKVEETMPTDLGALLDAGDGAIVMLVAGDTRLAAHRAVLVDRSPVFAAMFQHDTLEASSGEVAIADVEGPVLRQLVSYLYTLRAPQLPSIAPQLLATADKCALSGLKAECEKQVAAELALETAAATAVLAVRHSCSSLRQAALTFIKKHTHQVMATQGWADAMLRQPKDLIEVSRLLSDPPAETSTPTATQVRSTTTTTTTTASATRQSHSSQIPAAAVPATATATMYIQNSSVCSFDSFLHKVCLLIVNSKNSSVICRRLSQQGKNRRLIQAAEQGAVEELRALLAAGADVGVRGRGEHRMPALHWAVQGEHTEAVRCLLDAGAEVNDRDSDQNTPLHLAAYSGDVALVQILLESSADPNARDKWGRTPLHDAVWRGHIEAATMLLDAGADGDVMDDDGFTPLDKARQKNNRQLIDLLS
ncbi:ankyrin repeat, PH and SEC7 domain containing protein secG-like [Schistocerca cancellata]|uniref:ankyrin repeat, PH and SEC7 domain containing protein secG-like n=1 Tax=Schistocerca cancellata TaxID=274614 RepID=UPI002119569C|nr:ankyrin repeat, PH and SEC7 domain containing protein secG-like [Schistocerca cancellata]